MERIKLAFNACLLSLALHAPQVASAQTGRITVRKAPPAVDLNATSTVRRVAPAPTPRLASGPTTLTTARGSLRNPPAVTIPSSAPRTATTRTTSSPVLTAPLINPNEPSAAEAALLAKTGVPADYIAKAHASGYQLNPTEISRLYQAGVPADFMAQAAAAHYDLNPGEVIRLHQAGITSADLTKIAAAGAKFNPNELIAMRKAGVPADFIATLHTQHPGTSYSAQEVISLHQAVKKN